MNRKYCLLLFFLSIGSFLYLGYRHLQPSPQSLPVPYNSLYEKWQPNQHHFLQRASAKGRIELGAYEKALRQARIDHQERNASPGFTTPWTVQGPGNSGSRVNTIAVHPTNDNIMYLGYSSSGVFKTTDGGQHWEAIFDDQNFLGIGDITLDPANPEIVYVGTGDPNVTSYPFIGDGLYRSTDGGQNWTHLGLSEQRIISKIIVDPNDSDIIYVAAMGLPFERNNERGLYKTTDGGATWQQVLFLSNQTGVIDFLLDPSDSQILYAAGWDRISNSMENIGTGTGAKIHKSEDGGATWSVLSNGLPNGSQSRIGLAMSSSNPDLIYAMYINTSFQLEGVYKTLDGGANWNALPQTGLHSNVMGGQGWYFGQIRVHPNDHDKVYLLGLHVHNTLDGGNSWFTLTSSTSSNPVHVDMHDLVFTNNGLTLLLGTDGGAYRSNNGGGSFTKMENIPATQIYRTAYDPHRTDQFYGGSQDNGSIVGNAAGITQWNMIIGADGFQPAFNALDSNIFYLETQRGGIKVTTDAGQTFFSATSGFGLTDRRNWDLPYLLNSKNPFILYAGTHRVYRSETTTGIPAWQAISEDLCDQDFTNNPAFHTISCLGNSPIDSAIILAGTSDGNLWRTADEGANWTNITADLPDRYVTSIKASHEVATDIYVSFSGYDDNIFTPLIYKSTDAGVSWQSIAGNLPQLAINDLYILENTGDLAIFAATDGGVYATLDGGTNWERLGSDMPFVPVFDLDWHVAENLLIAGTHGRSIMTFPLDSIAIPSGNLLVSFGGTIQTPDGLGVDSAMVRIDSSSAMLDYTNEDGDFLLEQIPFSTSCQIQALKNENPRNGVNLFDLVLMQKHVINTQILDSPYKLIAADQDRNGLVSILDIIEFRKLLLFLSLELPDNPAWRFIPSNHIFANPSQPNATPIPEFYDCADLNGNDTQLDFVAVKMGDVDYSADPHNLHLTDVRNTAEPFSLRTANTQLQRGENFNLVLYPSKAISLAGIQFSLAFDPEVLRFVGFEAEDVLAFDDSYANLSRLEEGVLSICWHQASAIDLQEVDKMLGIKFEVLAAGAVKEVIQLNSSVTRAEILREVQTGEYQLAALSLRYQEEKSGGVESTLAQVFPNPFTTQTQLSYQLAQAAWVRWRVFNVQGQLLEQGTLWQDKSEHQLVLDESWFPQNGMYFLQLQLGVEEQLIRVVKR